MDAGKGAQTIEHPLIAGEPTLRGIVGVPQIDPISKTCIGSNPVSREASFQNVDEHQAGSDDENERQGDLRASRAPCRVRISILLMTPRALAFMAVCGWTRCLARRERGRTAGR